MGTPTKLADFFNILLDRPTINESMTPVHSGPGRGRGTSTFFMLTDDMKAGTSLRHPDTDPRIT